MKRLFLIPTALLSAALLAAGLATSGPASAKAAPKANNAAMISQGKALVSQYRCNGCHGADFHGKPGRTPNITQTGELKNYNQKNFERLLATGVEHDGKHLKHMPVMGLKPAQSDAIYAYLKTVK